MPNKVTPKKLPQNLEDLIQVRIGRLVEIIAQFARQSTQAHGLSNTDLRILNLLDGTEGVSMNEIARRAHVDKAWISRSVRKLKERGMVSRRSHKDDSRLQIIRLTEKSSQMIEAVRPLITEREKKLLKGIDSKVLKQQLDQLMINAETLLGEINNK